MATTYESEIGVLDFDEIKGENERLSDVKGGNQSFLNNFVRIPEGDCTLTLRVLPPRKGQKLFVATRLHYINGRSYHCRREIVNGRWVGNCPICDYYNALWKEIDKLEKSGKIQEAEALKVKARQLKPVERYYYNTIVRRVVNAETQEVETNVGPKIWSTGKKMHQKIVTAIVGDAASEEQPLGNVTDFKTGRDFKIIKKMTKGQGGQVYPSYDQSKFLEPSQAGDPDQLKTWVENMFDLTTLRSLKTNEELEHQIAILRGLAQADETSFDIEKFDAKFKNGSMDLPSAEEQTHETVMAKSSVPSSSMSDDDIPLPEEDFLKSIDDMNV